MQRPVKHHDQPMRETSGWMTTAAMAAPGLRSRLPKAKAPAACWGTHSVRKDVVLTKTQDMPKPAACWRQSYHLLQHIEGRMAYSER